MHTSTLVRRAHVGFHLGTLAMRFADPDTHTVCDTQWEMGSSVPNFPPLLRYGCVCVFTFALAFGKRNHAYTSTQTYKSTQRHTEHRIEHLRKSNIGASVHAMRTIGPVYTLYKLADLCKNTHTHTQSDWAAPGISWCHCTLCTAADVCVCVLM